jgi:hypothetical protein
MTWDVEFVKLRWLFSEPYFLKQMPEVDWGTGVNQPVSDPVIGVLAKRPLSSSEYQQLIGAWGVNLPVSLSRYRSAFLTKNLVKKLLLFHRLLPLPVPGYRLHPSRTGQRQKPCRFHWT